MASVKVVRPRVSYTDLQRAPEDGRRYELYDGEAFVVPAPLPRHQLVALNTYDALRIYTRSYGGKVFASPIDIVFSEHDVVQPDVVFFLPSRLHLFSLDAVIRVRPDLAVEVLSPSTAATDRGKKMQLLARYGVPEYWLVDPTAGTIERYRLVGEAYDLVEVIARDGTLQSDLLPGLSLPAFQVFAE